MRAEELKINIIEDTTIWQPMPMQTDNNLSERMTSRKINGTVKTNGTNGLNKDTNSHKWTPLLRNDNFQNEKNENQYRANNNEWNKNGNNANFKTENISSNWTDKLDIENDNQLIKNNNSSFMNGKAMVINDKGHLEKLANHNLLTRGGIGRTTEPDTAERTNCGIGSCQPMWARSFASTHVFMVVFLLAWILQGMYYTYFVSVITTIEKLFQIKSKTTGLLMSATEVGQISTSLFLTYYAGGGHRPRWIATGMVLFAIASFGCTLPHFIFGDQLLHANNVFSSLGNTQQHHNIEHTSLIGNFFLNDVKFQLSSRMPDYQQLCYDPEINGSISFRGDKECEEDILVEQASHSQLTAIILIIFVISLLGVGIGQTAVSTLGIPYIDDNVASRESPIYIAITIGVRILGPAAGFIMGSFCTKVYVNLSDPGFGTSDPRWVGAWWLGLVLVSSCMAITSLAMFAFPRNLRGHRIPAPMKVRAIEEQKKLEKQEVEFKTPKIKDFPKTIKRQLSNDILMFRTASSVLHLLPVAGLYTFLPKYLETQFRLAAHDANLIAGIGGILVMGVGIIISGVVILKFNPTARSVAAWIAFTAIIYAAGMAILMFVGCPMDDFAGFGKPNETSLRSFEPVCNTTCDCDYDKFSPICGSDGMTYFSSCHAGCLTSASVDGKMKFYNCTCIAPELVFLNKAEATGGYCDGRCKSFVLFISLFSFFVFMHSTSEVGSMLLIMRCTDPKDKAMAMGVIQFAIGLFGNVPCPIIYGAVVDSACLVWETICDKQGACSLYDIDMFRHFFLGTTAGIMALAFIMDLVVWHKAHRIDIDPESSTTSSETDFEKPITVEPESSV